MVSIKPEAITGGATLAAWFRCGVLVQRSLRVFAPSWRCCPDPFPIATFVSTSQTRLLTTDNSPARSMADGAFDTFGLTPLRWSGNCDTAGIMTPLDARLLRRLRCS